MDHLRTEEECHVIDMQAALEKTGEAWFSGRTKLAQDRTCDICAGVSCYICYIILVSMLHPVKYIKHISTCCIMSADIPTVRP